MTARALRVVLIANDGFSAGHVARSLAIARGLRAEAARRGLAVKCVLATTSQATALWKDEPVAVVTMPAPVAAREAGWADAEGRRVVRGVVDGVIERVAPDLVVVDTFPVGPHGELRGLHVPAGCKRVLVRRATEDRRAAAPLDLRDVLTAELARYDLRVHAGELGEPAAAGDGVRVPPIIFDARPAAPANLRRELGAARQLDHHAAWARLGLPELADQRVMLVAAGGGGDASAVARAEAIARTLVRLDRALWVVIARGPLAPPAERAAADRIRWLDVAPLQPHVARFAAVFAPAGYNTAHELAHASVRAVLFAQPRSFDDQAARARRLAAAGFAHALEADDDASIRDALRWIVDAPWPERGETAAAVRAALYGPPPPWTAPVNGAAPAAAAMIELVTRGAA